MSQSILVVEDELDLAATLAYNLQREGFQTVVVHTGKDAIEVLEKEPLPSMVLLDLMLPDMGGLDICKHIRKHERTQSIPVIILTAKGDEIDRVVGFEVGADDYVVKPFSVRELLLRIRALLRRLQPNKEKVQDEIGFGVLRVDMPGHRTWVADEEIKLTALEFNLLTTLISRKGRVQSRDVLLADVWGITAEITTRTVDTHVKRLREKLKSAGGYIETLRGVGYRFRSHIEEVE